MQKKLAPSKRKKDSFNTSTVIYDSRTGEYYYGMNKGVQLSGDSKNPILFGDKEKGVKNSFCFREWIHTENFYIRMLIML